ncbi:MAG TPA: T9SS type A sorting domain-containing protein [Bacteroidales bacterium]|nr:T9SS type A sorting domain-containing protein [Bacteroidales bacterium]
MKKILSALLFVIPFLLQAQNYTNICSPGTTFFKKMNTTQVKAYKTTSYTIPAAGDTIFYSFATIRDTAADCLDTTKGSILGRKIYRHSNDFVFQFFNKKKDTIYILCKALLNDTWRFTPLSSGTYLEAKVVSVGQDSVMNTLDEVKKIELTAKRNDGTVIPNPWNGKYLKLSKNYGLVRTFDMTNFPYDTANYTLVGKKSPVSGIQDFGWKEVYSYNIGDALHFSGYNNDGSTGTNSTWKEIQTVFSKTTYGTNIDSVIYKFDRCRSTVTNPGSNHVYIRDTITIKYRFTAMGLDSTIMRFPDQFVRRNMYASQYDRFMKAFNNRQTKKITEDKYRFLNNCFIIPSGSVVLYRNYSEGLGITEYYRDDQTTQSFYRLVYFKKGTETWGNPVGTECSPLLDVDETPVAVAPQVRIVPNPMKNRSEVVIDGIRNTDGMTFVLYNLVGKEVSRMGIQGQHSILERSNLPAGLYIFTLSGKEATVSGKLVIE